jgi:hypothetical protein
MIGLAAALNSVPGPQIFEQVNELAAEATLAISSVCTEIPPERLPAGATATVWVPEGLVWPGVTDT